MYVKGVHQMAFLSVQEYAAKHGMSRKSVQYYITVGKLEAVRIGSYWAIDEDEPKPQNGQIKTGDYIGMSAKYKKRKGAGEA